MELKWIILNIFIFLSIDLSANDLQFNYNINSKADLCQAIVTPTFFQKKLLEDESSRLAFTNLPGPIKRGICWWHSRFTRSSNYLIVFRPDILEKPNQHEVKKILSHLRKRDRVVEIKGYRNLYDFSSENKNLIEQELNKWSIQDTLQFKIFKGALGSPVVGAEKFKKLMDHLYYKVNIEGKMVIQMLQLEGEEAHAWIVVGMKLTKLGYELDVSDSNFHKIQKWSYVRGQTYFWYSSKDPLGLEGKFVPYNISSWNREEDKMIRVIKKYCAN